MATDDRKACDWTTAFTASQLETVLPQIRSAAAALLECWDRLREAELVLGIEILTDELAELAAPFDLPEDTHGISIDDVTDWLPDVVRRQRFLGS